MLKNVNRKAQISTVTLHNGVTWTKRPKSKEIQVMVFFKLVSYHSYFFFFSEETQLPQELNGRKNAPSSQIEK